MAIKVGDRVGAISHSEGDTLFFFGWGTYEGDVVPGSTDDPRPCGWMGEAMVQHKIGNPLIRLDNGKVVWGCECWWGPEAKVLEESLKFKKLVDVDIDQKRIEINEEA